MHFNIYIIIFVNTFAAVTLCGLYHIIWHADGTLTLVKMKIQKLERNIKMHKSKQKNQKCITLFPCYDNAVYPCVLSQTNYFQKKKMKLSLSLFKHSILPPVKRCVNEIPEFFTTFFLWITFLWIQYLTNFSIMGLGFVVVTVPILHVLLMSWSDSPRCGFALKVAIAIQFVLSSCIPRMSLASKRF